MGLREEWKAAQQGKQPPLAPTAQPQQPQTEPTSRKERKQVEKAQKQETQELEAFQKGPIGRARAAFERGDRLFQYSHDVVNQTAYTVAMATAGTRQTTTDPTEILNRVADEGWELVSGSFVFQEEGSQSRDKFLASGQQISVKGRTVGYYLFRMCEENRRTAG